MDMQNVAKLDIPEGEVRTIHDKNGNLLWGKVSYSVKYKGNTAQNGTPTPNAPVAVQTVTGEQTFSINGSSYIVNLGSIELCKIGTYQDYIYKSGGKWYLHKETMKKVFSGTQDESWATRQGGTTYAYQIAYAVGMHKAVGFCDYFVFKEGGATTGQTAECVASANTNVSLSLFTNNSSLSTIQNLKTWLASHNMSVYSSLSTPTDTEITNGALVAQLEVVEQLLTRYGYNATVTGNLPIIIDRTTL